MQDNLADVVYRSITVERHTMLDYQLIDEDVPAIAKKSGGTYKSIVQDFAERESVSSRIQYDRKPATLYISLKNAIKSNVAFKGIKVSRRGNNIYLCK